MKETAHKHAWSGWLWRAGRWGRVCGAATLRECNRLLGEHARRLGVPDWLCCMTGGHAPGFTPADADPGDPNPEGERP